MKEHPQQGRPAVAAALPRLSFCYLHNVGQVPVSRGVVPPPVTVVSRHRLMGGMPAASTQMLCRSRQQCLILGAGY